MHAQDQSSLQSQKGQQYACSLSGDDKEQLAEILAKHLLSCHLRLKELQALTQVNRRFRTTFSQVSASSWETCAERTLQALRPFSPAQKHPLLTAGLQDAKALMARLSDMRTRLCSGQHQVTCLPAWHDSGQASHISFSPSGSLVLVEGAYSVYLYSVAAPEHAIISGQLLVLRWSQSCPLDGYKNGYGEYSTTWAPDSMQVLLVNQPPAQAAATENYAAYALNIETRAVVHLPGSLAAGCCRLKPVFSPCSSKLILVRVGTGNTRLQALQIYCFNTWGLIAAWAGPVGSNVTGTPAFSQDGTLLALPLARHLHIYDMNGQLLQDVHAEIPRTLLLDRQSCEEVHAKSMWVNLTAVTWGHGTQLAYWVCTLGSLQELHIFHVAGTQVMILPSVSLVHMTSGLQIIDRIALVQQRQCGSGPPPLDWGCVPLALPSTAGHVDLRAYAVCLSPDRSCLALLETETELWVIDLVTGLTVMGSTLPGLLPSMQGARFEHALQWGLDCCSN